MKPENKYQNYIKYTSLGFQILAAVLIGVLAGQWLDKKFPNQYSLFTILLSLLMIGVALYQIYRMFLK